MNPSLLFGKNTSAAENINGDNNNNHHNNNNNYYYLYYFYYYYYYYYYCQWNKSILYSQHVHLCKNDLKIFTTFINNNV